MSTSTAGIPDARATFDRLLGELRPKLHRYCARMTGSVVDGEDVVQEALVKAIEALPEAGTVIRPEGWLFRIAHNAALDFLRRRARQDATRSDEDPDMIVDPVTASVDRETAAVKQARDAIRALSKNVRKRLEGVSQMDAEEIRRALREEVTLECQDELRSMRRRR